MNTRKLNKKQKENNEINNEKLSAIKKHRFGFPTYSIAKWLAVEYVGKCWYSVLFVLKYWFKSMRKLILLQEIRCRLNTCAISKICLKYLPQLPKYSTLNIPNTATP